MKRKTKPKQIDRYQLSFDREVFIDLFSGGGGTSMGIEEAICMPVFAAVNHDPDAIAMHMTNHPYTKHYQTSVWDVDPMVACEGRPVGLLWASPDCKHFSKARGGKPVNKNIRSLSWVVLKWALDVRPRVLMMENVEEIQTWGPLIYIQCGREKVWVPDPEHSGETFMAFIGMLTTGVPEDHRGRPYPKSKQVARCGNAVCPPMARAMVQANFPEYCDMTVTTLAQFHQMVTV